MGEGRSCFSTHCFFFDVFQLNLHLLIMKQESINRNLQLNWFQSSYTNLTKQTNNQALLALEFFIFGYKKENLPRIPHSAPGRFTINVIKNSNDSKNKSLIDSRFYHYMIKIFTCHQLVYFLLYSNLLSHEL